MPRLVQVQTPLGGDALKFRSLTGTEQLGSLFEYHVELVSNDEQVDFSKLLGDVITVEVVLPDDEKRYFHGYVSRFTQVGRVGNFALYRATLRPWLWFLTRTADCRIFHPDLTALDIIKEVFADYDIAVVDDSALEKKFRKREYTVQYRETDFNFISRLMEEEGIYYYFKHEEAKHTMVMCNSSAAHAAIPGCETLPYFPPGESLITSSDHVSDWFLSQEIQTGKWAATDYCFETPKAAMQVRSVKAASVPLADLEVFDYPGVYTVDSEGKDCAQVRIEEQAAQFEKAHGVCDARGMTCGGLFSMSGYPRDDQNREYLVVSATHDLRVEEQESGAEASEHFSCTFSVVESKIPYRPQRITQRPMIRGPQTAVVVGPSGDEIYTDKYGRVKVQFFWDREGKSDENSSCWIRVASVWAGHGWGGVQIPRIGQEVIVEFLEGDPDRPIITGRVYNADAMPPYELPANMTQSGIKSRSTKGAGTDNFNEFRFEDKKGEEELYIHAEKNHTNITENDRAEDVGHDRSLHVGHDKSEKVDNCKEITVGVDHSETIGARKTLSVGASHSETIGADMTITVASMLTETVGLNYAETVGGAMELSIGGAFTETVGLAKAETIGGVKTSNVGGSSTESVGGDVGEDYGANHSTQVAKDCSLAVGKGLEITVKDDSTTTIEKKYGLTAKKITVTGNDEISFQSGSAKIILKKGGDIVIEGKNIKIKGSSDVVIKGSKIAGN